MTLEYVISINIVQCQIKWSWTVELDVHLKKPKQKLFGVWK